MPQRPIIRIDEEQCDGCGLCVPACDEGAIQIVNGKAKVVSEIYCDGLGACLGHCPRGAITIVTRQAPTFDPEAVERHLAGRRAEDSPGQVHAGCPSAQVVDLSLDANGRSPDTNALGRSPDRPTENGSAPVNRLSNWPVQLHLVPPDAAFLVGADLMLAADCVPFAYADFHRRFLDGRPVVIGCPKLDETDVYLRKMTEIIRGSKLRSMTVIRMEVPCCSGLEALAVSAVAQSGVDLPVESVVVSRDGYILSEQTATGQPSAVGAIVSLTTPDSKSSSAGFRHR